MDTIAWMPLEHSDNPTRRRTKRLDSIVVVGTISKQQQRNNNKPTIMRRRHDVSVVVASCAIIAAAMLTTTVVGFVDTVATHTRTPTACNSPQQHHQQRWLHGQCAFAVTAMQAMSNTANDSDGDNEGDGFQEQKKKQKETAVGLDQSNGASETATNLTTTTTTTTTDMTSALALQHQAEKLRQEADALRMDLELAKEEKMVKRMMKIDGWIDNLLLIDASSDSNTEVLNTVDTVMQMLRDQRFSQEQVQTMYLRLRDLRPNQSSRSRCSPLMELLVDAAGKLDSVDREDNPNKRWNGKVERDLRRRLFAKDYGIDLDGDIDGGDGNDGKAGW
eukprot:CAMPEP_0198114772 /NCGR_PEP_ID=MMETSP1442-20131203/6051_1 /TAXON_ID= /ORGANISM="Craspedostauros australis, Strain CCMP3328" /LENGTH=332 /DNA_ID=CAMNT_0043772157 /DNA_START=30 /DNA_END=1025 /DNA_ORIENTATION=+